MSIPFLLNIYLKQPKNYRLPNKRLSTDYGTKHVDIFVHSKKNLNTISMLFKHIFKVPIIIKVV